MYEDLFGHFGLQRNPFRASPNPQSYYSTCAHDEALLQLTFAIESRHGLMVLTGEPGTGKSTVLQYLLEWLHQNSYSAAYIFHTVLPSVDLLRLILQDFGVQCSARSKGELLIALKEWLRNRRRMGDSPVIMIDEAQALTGRALDELRMLLNLETSGTPLVQLVLAGQPQLEDKLHRPRLAQLRQRLMCHCRLPALTLEETSGYISWQLASGGTARTGLFPQEAVEEIFRCSRGIPRVINLLCEHALLASHADKRESVSCDDVLQVAQQFDITGEIAAKKDTHRFDTFCRLIPVPKLWDQAATKAANSLPSSVPPPVTEPVAPIAAAEPVPVKPLPPTSEVVASLQPAHALACSPRKSRFWEYCKAVQSSFLRDASQLARKSVMWLRKPATKEGKTTAATRRLFASTTNWLGKPLGSHHTAPGPRRAYGRFAR